jgi:hypothetical protein
LSMGIAQSDPFASYPRTYTPEQVGGCSNIDCTSDKSQTNST